MAYRLCETCRSAENPLGKLRFKKHLDGKVYCENCIPFNWEEAAPPPSQPSSPLPGTSAGSLVVIPCPDCFGEGRASRHPVNKNVRCEACVGYGAVRIPENFLKVYTPKGVKPGVLTEG
jgi:hypothetical protein